MNIEKVTKGRLDGFNVGWGYIGNDRHTYVLVQEPTSGGDKRYRWFNLSTNTMDIRWHPNIKSALESVREITYPETVILRADQFSVTIKY